MEYTSESEHLSSPFMELVSLNNDMVEAADFIWFETKEGTGVAWKTGTLLISSCNWSIRKNK